ncbi:MAG TPA: MBOAT family O-acyltransferase [Verrucomicrobiota bacterium]|nr:MBOAT family O-acyltransferase [Verrucomicrobiota bacterium]HNU49470.1 MBOAT family O-acyltransferase [Verrucomicrobiota bacterium]
MNFAELRFWGFLFAGLGVLLAGRAVFAARHPAAVARYDRVGLITLGMFLLLCVSWLTFLIWLAVALGSYFGLQWILRRGPRATRGYLVLLIPLQLAPLLYYKYSNFVLNQVLGFEFDSLRHLLIPVGLSFYTFQKVAFVLDTLAFKEPLPRFLDYLNFAGFFPQIVAGPIERKRDLLPQMERFQFRWNPAWVDEGIAWVGVGLFFKMALADNLARWMPSFMHSTSNPFMIWLSNVLFGFRIYYDFAGYSLVAYGVARCLGVRLTLNFQSPYCSTSIQEFWRRWHVTLSQWFRDYVYIPLGGSRVRTWALNVAIVFVVSGIWHGAGWGFMVWGALHGAFLIAQRWSGRQPWPAACGWILTMLGAFLAWLAFYETRPQALWQKLITTFQPGAYSAQALRATIDAMGSGGPIVLAALLGLTAATLALEGLSLRRGEEPYALLRRPVVLAALVILTVLLAPGKNNAFIYFAF